MLHLQEGSDHYDGHLNDGPPRRSTIRTFACISKHLFSLFLIRHFAPHPLCTIKQTTNRQLKVIQVLFFGNVCIIGGFGTRMNGNLHFPSELRSPPRRRRRFETNSVLATHGRGERKPTGRILRPFVHHVVKRIFDFNIEL